MFLYKCSILFPLNGGKTSKEKPVLSGIDDINSET